MDKNMKDFQNWLNILQLTIYESNRRESSLFQSIRTAQFASSKLHWHDAIDREN